jgi:hypothetical protein
MVGLAMDRLGQLLALQVTEATVQERSQVGASAAAHSIQVDVGRLPEVKRGSVPLPRRRSAASPGQDASAASREMTNACSPSPLNVRNRL